MFAELAERFRASNAARLVPRSLRTWLLAPILIGLPYSIGASVGAGVAEHRIVSSAVTSAAPRTVYVYGDSILWELQPQLQFQLGLQGIPSVVQDAGGTALCDWIPTIQADVRAVRPASVVILFSGNAMSPCMSGATSDPSRLAKYQADLDGLASWLHAEGTPLMVVGAPPGLQRTTDALVIPTTWSVGQIPQGYQSSAPVLNQMYQGAVARYRERGWVVRYVAADSAVAAPDGRWTYVLPCLLFETADRGCNAQHLITVRAPDLVHLCPATAVPGSPGWCGGAWRYAAAISATLSPPIQTPEGYAMAASDGGVFTFGPGSHFYGSAVGEWLRGPIVGMARDPATGGYWLAASDGTVFAFNAPWYGSAAGWRLAQPVVGMAAAPDGLGYWLVARDGGVFAFGSSAHYYGSVAGTLMSAPIVGMAADPTTGGYWLVASDGRVFAFRAPFLGSTAGMALNRPIVGMAADPVTEGYWLVASDGGIFAFRAPFLGSTGGIALNQPVVGMAADSVTEGYWLVASDGGIFAFRAPFFGSTGGIRLARPVVGIAGAP